MFIEEPELSFQIRQGLEREALRSLTSGKTSLEPHPKELGSKLTHANITTDYAENLLEFITNVHKDTNQLLDELINLQSFTQKNLGDELIWPASMPCELPSEDLIPLAYYGESNVGKLKTLYRKGLGHRYGRQMQSIAGVHYNFSLSDSYWEYIKKITQSSKTLSDIKNVHYFSLIRNFQRNKWILMYLFGASPAVDKSFLVGRKHSLEVLNDETFYTPEGVSLRMGGLGYTSKAQESIGICYNQVETYIKTLEDARLKSYEPYEKIGLKSGDEWLQLNTNILQIDNEFYSTIRPKNIARTRESALMALHYRGVEYVEVRLLDLDPYSITGIGKEQIYFLHLFLLHSLMCDSPEISSAECTEVDENFNRVVTKGRSKNLNLIDKGRERNMNDMLYQYFDKLKPLVDALSTIDPFYQTAFDFQYRKISQIDLLPSQKVLNHMYGRSFKEFGLNLATDYKNTYRENLDEYQRLASISEDSFKVQKKIEAADKLSFPEFLDEYYSNIKINY